jgi:S1-C subfamily serine protease
MRRLLTHLAVGLIIAAAVLAVSCGGGGEKGSGADEAGKATPPASEPDGEEIASEEIVPRYEETAVFIFAEGFYGGARSGTGIVLDAKGHILTNNHVVDGAGSLSVRSPVDGREIPARIVGRSPCDDLAVIQARDPAPFVPATLGTVADIAVGSQVYAVGYPGTPSESFGETRLSLTGGLVSKLNAQFEYYGLQNMIQTDASVNHGNSGGPLVDKQGRVVGVITLAFLGAGLENVAYATGIDEAKLVYEQLLLGKDIDWLGVNVVPSDPQLEVDYGVPYVPDSVVIMGVDTSSPLFEQGWIAGDVLLAAEGQLLSMPGDLCAVIRSHRRGDQILLEGLGQFDDGVGGIYYDQYSTTAPLP